jgi:hypothetical protein
MPTSAHDVRCGAWSALARRHGAAGEAPGDRPTTRAHRTSPHGGVGRSRGATTGAAHGAGTARRRSRGARAWMQGRCGLRAATVCRAAASWSCGRRGPARRSPGPWCPPDRRACAASAAAACACRGHPGGCRYAREHLPRHRRLSRQRRPPSTLEAHPCRPPACEAAAGLTSAFVWCLRGQAVALASGKRTPGGTGGQPTHRKSLCLGCKRL